ncbi:MAG: stage III sporulation protein AE [Bacillota bacterium]|nr:stage III sporulation protein AE [Bacillota bacterium]
MEYEEFIEEQLNTIDTRPLNDLLKENEHFSILTDDLTVSNIVNSMLNGQAILDSDKIFDELLYLLLSEIKSSLVLAGEILTICIVIGLLSNMSNSFGSKTSSYIGTIICSFIVIALCIGSFHQTYECCTTTLNVMTKAMELLLPILIPLLISMGGLSSASIMNPAMAAAVTGFNFIIQNIVMPLIFLSTIFILINSITEKDYIKRLSIFIRKAALFITGLCITIFSGITAVQSIVAKSADGILMNTARFSISNFVPIVGGFASDSIEMVISCIGLIKNAVGIVGIIIIVSLLILPIIKIMAIALIYKLTSIVAEPVATKNISDGLNELGSSAVTMTVVLACGAFMFLIFITIIMSMGGGSLWTS